MGGQPNRNSVRNLRIELYLKIANFLCRKRDMTSALRVYSHVACFLFLFSTGRLAMPQVRHESEGTPRFLLSAMWGVYWVRARGDCRNAV